MSFNRMPQQLPAQILALCLIALGIGIHQKTSLAIAPPIYDPMAYYTKGAAVWQQWSAGNFINPFDVQPSVRPPGTMLISAPLGFSPDFREFFFRSIFIPLAVFVLAFWVLAESQVKRPRQRWANLVGALMLASLPLFYQFERTPAILSPSDWGYMDSFVGALAALSVALLIVSVQRLSLWMLSAGVIVGEFTLLVKPVGLALFLIFCFLWAVELACRNWPLLPTLRETRAVRRYAVWASVILIAGFGATAAVCLRTAYLSPENLKIGYYGQGILIGMFKGVPLWTLIGPQIPASFGWHWFFAFVAMTLFLTVFTAFRMAWYTPRTNDFRFLAALAVLLVGVVWWIALAGPAQIRYLYPFPMIFLVIMLPGALAAASRSLPRPARWGAAAACLAPLAVIIALLFTNAPSLGWQKLVGINLSAGQFRQEVAIGEFLVEQARKEKRSPVIYVLPTDERPGVVESVAIYRNILSPESPLFTIKRPNDWIRTTMVRRNEFVQADYTMFYPVRDAARLQALLAQPAVNDPVTESDFFSAWLTTAGEDQGIHTVSDGYLRLIKVIDRAKLDQAFGQLVPRHKWRDEFYAENANPAFQQQGDLTYAQDPVALYRFVTDSGSHFYQTDCDKVRSRGHGYKLEGIAAYISKVPIASGGQLFVLHGPTDKNFFYTADSAEREEYARRGFRNGEAIGYISKKNEAGVAPLFRSHNPTTDDYLVTMDSVEWESASKVGWEKDGVVGYAWAAGVKCNQEDVSPPR